MLGDTVVTVLGSTCACMIGERVAASRRGTTSMYPVAGVVDVSRMPDGLTWRMTTMVLNTC